jgi:hypothetical protein
MDDELSGAIVQTNIGWVHISCVNWLPELYFEDAAKKQVHGEIWESRKNQTCCYSKKRN